MVSECFGQESINVSLLSHTLVLYGLVDIKDLLGATVAEGTSGGAKKGPYPVRYGSWASSMQSIAL